MQSKLYLKCYTFLASKRWWPTVPTLRSSEKLLLTLTILTLVFQGGASAVRRRPVLQPAVPVAAGQRAGHAGGAAAGSPASRLVG